MQTKISIPLLNKKISLQKDDLVFLNNKKEVVNLAGIMGGKETSAQITLPQ